MPETHRNPATPTRKVVVVNGNSRALGMLESVLDAGHYDMVFVESDNSAYGPIRKIIPDLVVLCARLEEPDGFQVLSMLKLDPNTREIPVLTCTSEGDEPAMDDSIVQLADEEEDALQPRAGLVMN